MVASPQPFTPIEASSAFSCGGALKNRDKSFQRGFLPCLRLQFANQALATVATIPGERRTFSAGGSLAVPSSSVGAQMMTFNQQRTHTPWICLSAFGISVSVCDG